MKPSLLPGAKYPAGPEFTARSSGHFRLKGAGVDCILFKDYEIARHTHDFTELNLVIGGRGEHFIDDKAFAVEAGDVFVIPPNVKHAYRQKKHLDVYHLLLNQSFMDRHAEKLWMLPGFILFFTVEPFFRAETDFRFGLKLGADRTARVATTLGEVLSEITSPSPESPLIAESLALYAIGLLCRDYRAQFGGEGKALSSHSQTAAIQEVMAHVDANYARKLSLKDLARVAHMAPNHLGRVFRNATHLTPMEYLQRARVRAAQSLLLTTDLSVTDIAHKAGFYDGPHFSRTFAQIAGASPQAFRRAAQKA